MMTTSARVLFADLRTDRLIDTLPVRDIEWDDYIGKTGSLRGTIAVPDDGIARRCMRLLTARTAVWMEQGGQIVWGGILWTRTPQTDERGRATMAIQAAGWESYLTHRLLYDGLTATATDQLDIARQLIAYVQASDGGDIGIEMDLTQMSGVLRDRTYSRYDHSRIGELLDQLAAVEDGFEWRIQSWRDTAGIRHKSLRLGYPIITAGSEDVILDYPGRIQSISWPEDGTSQANAWQSRGSSTNNNQAADSVPLTSPLLTYPDMIAAGWPRLDGTSDYTTVIEQDTIDAHAAADLALARTPRLIPEVTISLAGGYVLPELRVDRAAPDPRLDLAPRRCGAAASPRRLLRPATRARATAHREALPRGGRIVAEVPQDLLDRLRALEEKVRLMDGRGQIRPAQDVVTDGEVHVGTNGRLVLDDVDGSQLLFAGGITPNYADGSPQRGVILWRSSGEIAAALYADGADATKTQQVVLWDKNGAIVLATGTDGLARPYIPIPMYPEDGSWPSTTAGAFTALWTGEVAKQHHKLRVVALGVCSGTAAGQLQLTINGTPVGTPSAHTAAGHTYGIWTVDAPGAVMGVMTIQVQGKVTSGTGAIRCRIHEAHGGEA
ncbi:hypothetical protein ACU686_40560 [Yinghuangia aomiensis]